MKVKVVKGEKTIKIFLDEKEIQNIASFKFERNQDGMKFMNLNLKVLIGDIEFIEKKED